MSRPDFPTIPDGPYCGCTGCLETADAVIDHPEKGERTVCEDHVNGHEVIESAD